MPTFAFAAHDITGRAQNGTLDADTYEAALSALREQGLLVLDLTEREASMLDQDVWSTINPGRLIPVGLADVELSLRQLGVMLRSGLALMDSLRMLAEHSNRHSMRAVWAKVADKIFAGESLAEAMAEHYCFPRMAIQLTRVGEETGELSMVVARAADLIESRRNLRSKILTALAYPVVVFCAAVAVAFYMVFTVIPKLERFLQSLGRTLPPLTEALITTTNFIQTYVWHGAISLTVLTVLFLLLRSWPPGRFWIDRLMLYVPILRKLLRLTAAASLSRNLQIMLQSGVSLLEAMRSVEQLLSNRFLAHRLSEAREAVIQGESMAEALEHGKAFPPLLARMVRIGETSGRLDEVLGEAADFYEDLMDRMVRWLAALVEPAMLIVVGGIVGFVYLAFFSALYAAAR